MAVKRTKAAADSCGNCKFARSLGDDNPAVSCQRNPPMITKVDGAMVTAHWPLIGKDKWCGEHKRATPQSVVNV